jgi:hypothetical protein
MVVHRVSPEDAKFLETQYVPTFTANDIIKIENLHAYVKMLSNNIPAKPFDIVSVYPPKGNKDQIDQLKELSYVTYGRPKDEVDEEIMRKFTI